MPTRARFPSDRLQTSLPFIAAGALSAAAVFLGSRLAKRVRRSPVNLRGKVALITGGSRGLGLALAQELGEYGCQLALVARDSAELDRAVEKLRTLGIEASAFATDITDAAGLAPLAAQVIQRFGSIDILVNDAGAIKVSPLENLQHADFEEAMNLMFWAPVNLTFAVLPHMRRRGSGHIVNISSVGGKVSIPHLLPYSCAKFAFTGFSTGLSGELNADEIHVLTVIPGLMRTGSYLNATFKGQTKGEFAWFSLLGNTPGISVSASQAAREIRLALQARELTCTISLAAKLLIHSETLAPEATRALMEFANNTLLPAAGQNGATRGNAVNPALGSVFQALTSLGRLAATSFNE